MANAVLRSWPLWALLASAAMLAAAHGFEYFGYEPCLLCLRQREIYWGAIGVAVAALAIAFVVKRPITSQIFDVLLGLVFLTGAVVAAYHAGVEWRFWPGPSTCGGNAAAFDSKSILDALKKPIHAVRCDEAAWRLFGLSMAGYNAVISLGLAGASLLAALAPRAEEDHARAD